MAKDVSKPKWFMIERGRVWHLRLGDKILGHIHFNFSGWDGYIETGKKWPNHQRCVSYNCRPNDFWHVRQSVQDALEDVRGRGRVNP